MAGLSGKAAILGFAELPATRLSAPVAFDNTLDLCAHLAQHAVADAGIERNDVDGLITCSLRESRHFVPATLSEYCGFEMSFGDIVDLGGAGLRRAAAFRQSARAAHSHFPAPGVRAERQLRTRACK